VAQPDRYIDVLPAHRESTLHDLTTSFAFGSIADENDEQSSVEIRLASENQGLIRWLVGGYYFHETIDAVYQFNEQAFGALQNLDTGTAVEGHIRSIHLCAHRNVSYLYGPALHR